MRKTWSNLSLPCSFLMFSPASSSSKGLHREKGQCRRKSSVFLSITDGTKNTGMQMFNPGDVLVDILHHYLLILQYNKMTADTDWCMCMCLYLHVWLPQISNLSFPTIMSRSAISSFAVENIFTTGNLFYTHTSFNCVIFGFAPETLPVTVYPTNINRARPYTHICSDVQPEAEAGKASSHEKRATLSLLSSTPAGPSKTITLQQSMHFHNSQS